MPRGCRLQVAVVASEGTGVLLLRVSAVQRQNQYQLRYQNQYQLLANLRELALCLLLLLDRARARFQQATGLLRLPTTPSRRRSLRNVMRHQYVARQHKLGWQG